MGRFEIITKELDSENLNRHNRNWDKADADLATQLAMILTEQAARILAITSEEQNRINADNAHANAGTAHQATQISYDAAKSVKQRLDELIAQVTNIVAQSGSGNTAIDDMRLGADNVARATPGILIREIHTQQLEMDTQSVPLKHGLNII
jgi:hypothetical protein